jgi:hypothetical protein
MLKLSAAARSPFLHLRGSRIHGSSSSLTRCSSDHIHFTIGSATKTQGSGVNDFIQARASRHFPQRSCRNNEVAHQPMPPFAQRVHASFFHLRGSSLRGSARRPQATNLCHPKEPRSSRHVTNPRPHLKRQLSHLRQSRSWWDRRRRPRRQCRRRRARRPRRPSTSAPTPTTCQQTTCPRLRRSRRQCNTTSAS